MGEEDVRFSELLRPIKDLTENWEVPLSQYLETYYEELHELGVTTGVNFTEAALLLQQSATVYGKKVDFLWQIALKVMDMLSSNRVSSDELDQSATSGGPTKRKRLQPDDLEDFSAIVLKPSTAIDMKTDPTMSGNEAAQAREIHQRKMQLRFIFITPRQFVEKEAREHNASAAVYLYLKSQKTELLGLKSDFRINSQFDMNTAMVGEDLSFESQAEPLSVSLYKGHMAAPPEAAAVEPLCQPCADSATPSPQPADDDDELLAPEEILDEIDRPATVFTESNDRFSPIEMGSRKRNRVGEANNVNTKNPLADPWEFVQLHIIDQVAMKRQTVRSRNLEAKIKPIDSKSKAANHGDMAADQIVLNHMEALAKTTKLPQVIYPDDLKNDINWNIKLPNVKVMNGGQSKPFEAEAAENCEAEDDWTDCDAAVENDEYNQVETEVELTSELPQVDSNSYEELVIKSVAAYVAQSQKYMESTDLAKRVRTWHDTIAPKLEQVERRGDFDVHCVGTKIIAKLKMHSEPGQGVSIKSLVTGSSKEEVSRLFLSSLMLTNTHNIELKMPESASNNEKGDLMMDCVQVSLISTQRHHHHLMDYQAPSQQDTDQARKPKRRLNAGDKEKKIVKKCRTAKLECSA